MFKHTLPAFLPLLVPSLTWKVKTNDKAIYLTFDDGPHPLITPWVINLLAEYNAKATFFCVGENVKKFPKIYQLILDTGHVTGNHTFNHISGWSSSKKTYLENIQLCHQYVQSKLFRPPYGRIAPHQIQPLKNLGYRIVMWDILTRDYDSKLNVNEAFDRIIEAAKPGSIIVFHDSEKAEKQLKELLPQVLNQLAKRGFIFKELK